MTSPEPAPSPGSSADPGVTGGSPAPATSGATPAPALPGSLPEETVEALQLALTTEHAAIWAYGLIAAFDKDNLGSITAMRDAHLVRRNDTSARLTAGGSDPGGRRGRLQSSGGRQGRGDGPPARAGRRVRQRCRLAGCRRGHRRRRAAQLRAGRADRRRGPRRPPGRSSRRRSRPRPCRSRGSRTDG